MLSNDNAAAGVGGGGGGDGGVAIESSPPHLHHSHQHRLSRVSPIPGRGSFVAYSACPVNDPDVIGLQLRLAGSPAAVAAALAAESAIVCGGNSGGIGSGGSGYGSCGSGVGGNVLAIPMSAIKTEQQLEHQRRQSTGRAMSVSSTGGATPTNRNGCNGNQPTPKKRMSTSSGWCFIRIVVSRSRRWTVDGIFGKLCLCVHGCRDGCIMYYIVHTRH